MLGRLGGRQMRQQIRIGDFNEVDPTRAAGSDHRQLSAGLQPMQQFMSFFEYRQVGRKIGIKHFVKTKPSERGNHFSCDNMTAVHAERFAECNTSCRRSLHDDMFGRITDCIPDCLRVILFNNGCRRTDAGALTAESTGRHFQSHVKSRSYGCVKTAFGKTVHVNALTVTTSLDATAAQNTFVLISY